MSMKGYIRIPRSLLNDPLYIDTPPAYKEVFFVMLQMVCFKPQKFDDHGHIIELQVGQFCASYSEIHKKCSKHIKLIEIERTIKKFILCQFVCQEVRYRKSIITITHPDTYDLIKQSCEVENEVNLSQTRVKLELQKNKEKKEKNEKEDLKEKNIKKEKIKIREWVALTQIEIDSFFEKHDKDLANQMLDILDSYNTSRQKHYDSDYGALKNAGWVYNEAKKRNSSPKIVPHSSLNVVDRRTKNIDGTPVTSIHDGRF